MLALSVHWTAGATRIVEPGETECGLAATFRMGVTCSLLEVVTGMATWENRPDTRGTSVSKEILTNQEIPDCFPCLDTLGPFTVRRHSH